MALPRSAANSGTFNADSASTRFAYSVDPDHVDTTIDNSHPSLATLRLSVVNGGDDPIDCSAIRITIPIGDNTGALTLSPMVTAFPQQPSAWAITNVGYGEWIVSPVAPVTGVQPHDTVQFTLTGIVVSHAEGTAAIGIVETTDQDRVTAILVNKANAPLAITRFEAASAKIEPGASTTLSWDTTGAEYCTLTSAIVGEALLLKAAEGDHLLPNGQTKVTPTDDTVYTLAAYGDGARISQQFTVAVRNPRVLTFTADRYQVAPGDTVTLKWTTTDADYCMLQDQHVDANGSKPVKVDHTTTFQLFPHRQTTGNKAALTVKIPDVHVDSFTAEPSLAAPGSNALLSWSVSNAIRCSIDQGIGSVNPADSREITPTVATSYRLDVSGPDSNDVSKMTVTPRGWFATNLSTPLFYPTVIAGPDRIIRIAGSRMATRGGDTNVDIYTEPAGWTTQPTDLPTQWMAAGVFFNGKYWVFDGTAVDKSNPARVMSSPDGIHWSSVAASPPWPKTFSRPVVFQNALWMIARSIVWKSLDAVNWTGVANIASAGHYFVSTGATLLADCGGWLSESADGKTWNTVFRYDWYSATQFLGAARGVVLRGAASVYDRSNASQFRNRGGTWLPAPLAMGFSVLGAPPIDCVTFDSRIFLFGYGAAWYLRV